MSRHRRGSGYTGQGAGANRHSRENSRQPTGREDGGRTGGGSNGDGGGGNSGGGGRRAGGRTGRDSSGGKGRCDARLICGFIKVDCVTLTYKRLVDLQDGG